MRKTGTFRTKLWLYFVMFAVIIMAMLWLLQTVFFQSLYNRMLAKNTRTAAEEIASAAGREDLGNVIDRLSAEDSLLVFVTDTDENILYSSDSYKSYYRAEEHNVEHTNEYTGGESNPYHKGKTLSWQTAAYRNLPDGYQDFLNELAQSPEGKTESFTDTQYVYGKQIKMADGSEAVLYTSTALGGLGAAVSVLKLQLFWVTVLSLLIAFGIAWILARKFSVPVSRLSAQAKMLPGEDYQSSFEKGFCRELDELSDALDDSAEDLAKARNYQKELLANVSHDLRTPLTMIKGYAEMVRDISWEDETQRNADTGIIIREADRLTALVNEILEYSRLQESGYHIRAEDVDLSALVNRVADQFAPLMEQEGIRIERKIADGCFVKGDAALLERAVYNLMDNALRHAGEEKKITVSLTGKPKVCLSVRDYGEGIDPEELPHIWEKYYTSRQRGKKGVSGLGLAIVKQIAGLHGARYGVDSRKGEGSTFWLVFS